MPYFISNYYASALEYSPVRHSLFSDESTLKAFPQYMPQLIGKQTPSTPTHPSVIGSSHVFTNKLHFIISHAPLTS